MPGVVVVGLRRERVAWTAARGWVWGWDDAIVGFGSVVGVWVVVDGWVCWTLSARAAARTERTADVGLAEVARWTFWSVVMGLVVSIDGFWWMM